MQQATDVILALQEQLACYRRLAKLAESQREHVQRSNTEALLEVLRLRQEILTQLAQLEQIVGPAKRRWTDFIAEIDGEDRAGAESLVAETRRLLEQIMASDRTDALALQQRKLNVGRQIKQATGAKKINRTYSVAAYGTRASRVDIRSE
jgi:hypothetical protein